MGIMAKLMICLLTVALVAACSSGNSASSTATSAASPARTVHGATPSARPDSPPPGLPTGVTCPGKAPAGHDAAWRAAFTVGCGAALKGGTASLAAWTTTCHNDVTAVYVPQSKDSASALTQACLAGVKAGGGP